MKKDKDGFIVSIPEGSQTVYYISLWQAFAFQHHLNFPRITVQQPVGLITLAYRQDLLLPSEDYTTLHKKIISSLIFSELDYYNSLLLGISQEKMKHIQNNAAQLVSMTI